MEISFRYKKAQIIEYSFKSESEFDRSGNVEFRIGLRFSNEEKSVIILCEVTFFDKSGINPGLIFKVAHYFEIKEYDKLITKENNSTNIKLPDEFLLEAINLSIGSTRGMLIVKNSGTSLESLILPNFDHAKLLEGIKKNIPIV